MKYFLKFILLLSIVGCVKEMKRVNPIDGKTLPLLTTNPVTTFTSTSAIISGTINSNGGLPISSKGIVWSITPNSPSDLMSKLSNGVGEPTFTTSLSGLNPATKYYVRAYAVNLVGTAYGSELSFTTKSDTPYITTTAPAIPALYNNTVTGGNVTAENGSPVTVRGLVYGLTQFPTTELSTIVNDTGKGPGAYIIKLTKLLPATTYYARAYARNAIGRSYGNQITIVTPATTPTFTTIPPTYKSTTASTGGTFVSNGGATVTDKGIVWSTSPIASTTPITSLINKISKGAGDVSFSVDITGLIPGTQYYVYAYATNVAGTSYGTQEVFTTDPVTPTVSTGTSQPPGPTSVEISSIIVDDGGANITDFGWVYSTNPTPSLNNGATKFSVGNNTGTDRKNISFFNTIKNLKPNTTYYIRAYATNAKGLTGYGSDLVIKTSSSIPIVVINSPTTGSVADIYAKLTGSIVDNGGANITSAGIYYSTSPGVSTSNTLVTDPTVPQSSINVTINGLTSNKTYYAKAYATNMNGTALSSNEVSFTTTDNNPKLSVVSVSGITINSATVSAKTLSQGNQAITSKGFIYKVDDPNSNTPITFASNPINIYIGVGLGDMNYILTGLIPGTTYNIRAYASNNNALSYGYGDEVNFTALSTIPTVVTDIPGSTTQTTALVSGSTTSDGGDPITQKGFVWSTVANPVLTTTNFSNNGTGVGSFSNTISGLISNKTYYYRAYAKNANGIAYGIERTFRTLP